MTIEKYNLFKTYVLKLIGIKTIKYQDIFVSVFLINIIAAIITLYKLYNSFKINNIAVFLITVIIFALLFYIGKKYGINNITNINENKGEPK